MHDDDDPTPELRPSPPWVMEEMILLEADLPAEIAAGAGPAHLGRVLAGAGPVLTAGCGTSEHAARGAAAILRDALPGRAVAAADAFEAQLAPPADGVVIGISHEAGTRPTLDAVRQAIAAGANAALITARPRRAPAEVEVIGTPWLDRSWCHTVAYLSPLLTIALAAGTIDVARATAVIEAEIAGRDARRAEAERLAGRARLVVVASGVDEVTAWELALKIEEATHVPTTPLGAEKVLHGHLPAADASTGIVQLRFDPSHADARDGRAAALTASVAEIGIEPVTLRPSEPVAGVTEALLAGGVALQLLTLELSHALGTNPDLIRREQEPYRRAAEAGGAG